ncbi:MFS transporter [Marinagarivorans cellulosilyticus]|uniref:Major facilitator superfamily (MFS) profile domain-containing protein n=1 Tax=Marinagarivorans cellulosilyticus TaxID=2721545 RepID=A0AAN2BJM1_9GAMM|nr:MFS transporter [Marinagarivorans cellulosilyticus]BCD97143.1 hypothetical protein MARGE09_P1344 [Marinagarivorans cellulosilyticus]
MLHLPRPLYVLAFAGALLMAGMPMALLIGGIVGVQLAPSPALATLPLAAMVIGVAAFALPASKILDKGGYKQLFLCGTLMCLGGNGFAIAALIQQSFYLWLSAMLCLGFASACAQQLRFSSRLFLSDQPHRIPVALSVFMLGGILAAIVGPELTMHNEITALPQYGTGFVIVSGMQLMALALVLFLPAAPSLKPIVQQHAGPINQGVLAVVVSVTAYGIMSFVMTATPISMHEHHGHTMANTKSVIQWHILAMFIPSFFTGRLIQWLGIDKSLILGIIFYLAVFTFTLSGVNLNHYATGLILLGIGWNILFTTGSTLAAQHTNPNFKGKHDMLVFSIQAISSLSAGAVLYQLHWQAVQWVAIAGLLPLVAVLLYKFVIEVKAKQSAAG